MKIEEIEEVQRLLSENKQYEQSLAEVQGRLIEVEEDLLALSDAFDNIGYSDPLLDDRDSSEMSLGTIKGLSKTSRALLTVNPFVKRGIKARQSYVWGRGVSFNDTESIQSQIDLNYKKLFSPQAYAELEEALATDGNVFTALPIDKKERAYRIPLDYVVGAVSDPKNREDVWYYKIQYEMQTVNSQTGNAQVRVVEEYIISQLKYEKENGKIPQKTLNKVKVNQDVVLHHMAVNRQVGWRWGVPDIAAVIVWARLYKESLESDMDLKQAYSRYAMRLKVPTAQSGQQASAAVRELDAQNKAGGVWIGTHAIEAMPNSASTVDFSKSSALAGAIASGLEVSKIVILSDPGEGSHATAQVLELPTLKAMEFRQSFHSERFLDIFKFWGAKVTQSSMTKQLEVSEDASKKGSAVSITFPQIQSDTTKDRIASITMSKEADLINAEEARRDALETLNIAPVGSWRDIPDNQMASVAPSQGVSGGIASRDGAITPDNDARDNREVNANLR